MSDFHIKKRDLAPTVKATLVAPNGNPILLAGDVNVYFNLRLKGTTGIPKVNRGVCTILDATAGRVEYVWAGGDTDTAGLFEAEFEVVFGPATPMTFPNRHYKIVEISDDIA